MTSKSPEAVARFFGFYFYAAAALLSVIAISQTKVFEIRPETAIYSALFICYVVLLAMKRKKRVHHILLGFVFFALVIVASLLIAILPDMFSKCVLGIALFSLCLSYGIPEGIEFRSHVDNHEYDVDYQSLISDIRGNNKLMHSITHDVTKMLFAQVYQEETERIFAIGKPNTIANIKWEMLSQAVSDIIADGYALKILELQESGEQLSKPVMADLDIMLPLWRKYVLTHAKTPSSEFLRNASKQLATHKGRFERRKLALASVSAFRRATLTNSQAPLLRLGYKIADFENHYRTEEGKREINSIEKSIESEFFKIMKLCEKLPLALDGTLARLLLIDTSNMHFDSYKIHLACIHTDADEVIGTLEEAGFQLEVICKDALAVRRYQLFSDELTTIELFIEVYMQEEDTDICTAVDAPSEQKFAGLANFQQLVVKGHKVKTLPPSFFLQQIMYCWADYPETKDIVWAKDYTALLKKYYSKTPLDKNPLFEYALGYRKTEVQESVIKYSA